MPTSNPQGDGFPTNILDHIIHFAPPGELDKAIEQFESSGFKVLPGGTHTGGLTHNALVVFADGVYIEVIAFIHDISHYPEGSPERKNRETDWWADQKPGWAEYANLGLDKSISKQINSRAKEELFLPPQAGGRQNNDGVELKWNVTIPFPKLGHGVIPFFCEDVTDRALRVPIEPPSNVKHSNTALGVAQVTIFVSFSDFNLTSERLSATLGVSVIESATQKSWILKTPHNAKQEACKLVLEATDGGKVGISQVKFWVAPGSKPPPARTIGAIDWVEVEDV